MRAKHIVVVDDDADVFDVIEQFLKADGYRVSGFVNSAAMREAVLGEPVDLLVLDGPMRGETPATIADFVKAVGLPVVMMSGNPDSMKIAEEQRLQLLWKPFSGAGLLRAVERALASGEIGQRSEDPDYGAARDL